MNSSISKSIDSRCVKVIMLLNTRFYCWSVSVSHTGGAGGGGGAMSRHGRGQVTDASLSSRLCVSDSDSHKQCQCVWMCNDVRFAHVSGLRV